MIAAQQVAMAMAMTLRCERCVGTVPASETTCPQCGQAAPSALLATVYEHIPGDTPAHDRTEPVAEVLVIQRGDPTIVTARVALRDQVEPDRPIVGLYWDRTGRLATRNFWDRPVWLAAPGGDPVLPVEPGTKYPFPGPAANPGWDLRFGLRNERHRLLRVHELTGAGPA